MFTSERDVSRQMAVDRQSICFTGGFLALTRASTASSGYGSCVSLVSAPSGSSSSSRSSSISSVAKETKKEIWRHSYACGSASFDSALNAIDGRRRVVSELCAIEEEAGPGLCASATDLL